MMNRVFRGLRALTAGVLALCVLLPGPAALAAGTDLTDVAPEAWYADAVNAMAAKGFFAGDGSAFRPEDTITYEEMVTVLSSVAAWMNSSWAGFLRISSERTEST